MSNTTEYIRNDCDGFSLLEVIVTITIAAILGIIIIQFMGTNLSRSAESVVALQDTAELVSEMEKLTLNYRDWLNSGGTDSDWATFRTTYVDPLPLVNASFTGERTLSAGDGFPVFRVVMEKNGQTMENLFSAN